MSRANRRVARLYALCELRSPVPALHESCRSRIAVVFFSPPGLGLSWILAATLALASPSAQAGQGAWTSGQAQFRLEAL